jgi:predicted amidophosphoribosyltransferase
MSRSLAHSFLSLVVPPLCAACREPEFSGAPVCPACAAAMPAIGPCCHVCGAPFPGPVASCLECRGRRFAFERAWAPFAYTGAARRLVLGLKAGGLLRSAAWMAAAIACRAPPGVMGGVLIPAPAHGERMRRQGHNHACELARALGRRTGLPVADVLARRPGGRPQAGLAGRARRANVRGRVVLDAMAPPGRALIVDDVYTTGSTLDACAAALRAAGTGPVSAVCFARAVRGPPAVARSPGAP